MRSRRVAESHHVIYAELDRLLDISEVSATDPTRVWRQDADLLTELSVAVSNPSDDGTSPTSVVSLNCFNSPSFDHQIWTQAGLVSATPPPWCIPLRNLVFSESDEIGRGSFGIVYKGMWLDTPIVVKFMGYESDAETISTDLLLHEVRVWHRLNHPHVLKLYGACHVDRRFFVCEFAPNGDLQHFLRQLGNERLTWQKLYEVALGLEYLHGQNVVHSDLKLDNILVGADGRVKLIGFGLSCLMEEAEIQIEMKSVGAVN
ncbi:Tkl protein kinase [Globisporangium polare]